MAASAGSVLMCVLLSIKDDSLFEKWLSSSRRDELWVGDYSVSLAPLHTEEETQTNDILGCLRCHLSE